MPDRCSLCYLDDGLHRFDCPRLASAHVTLVPAPTPSDRLLAACRKLKAARDAHRQRVRDLQAMATEARRTGRPGDLARYDHEHPTVWNIEDIVEEICEALEGVDRG